MLAHAADAFEAGSKPVKAIDLVPLHAKIGQLTLENDFLESALKGLWGPFLRNARSCPTRQSVELATLEWVSWFNHHRLLEPIGYIPPVEAEANYYRQLASQVSTVEA